MRQILIDLRQKNKKGFSIPKDTCYVDKLDKSQNKHKQHAGKALHGAPESTIEAARRGRVTKKREGITLRLPTANVPWKGCVMRVAAERAIISRVV